MGLLAETVRDVVTLGRKAAVAHPAGGPWLGRVQLWGERSYAHDLGSGDSSSLVTILLAWKMRVFPEAPVMLQQRTRDGLERVMQHPFLSTMARPNAFYSQNHLWMATTASLTVDGNAYWRVIPDDQGRLELWYLPHWMVEPKWPQDGSEYISHYEYRPGGIAGTVRLESKEVVHFRFGLDPDNVRKGWSPLKNLLREVYTDEEAARFTASMLRNAGVPGLVVSPDDDGVGQPTVEELEALKGQFIARTTGDRRGEPLIMAGATKVQQFGFSPSEMDLSALRAIPESRVAAAFGIPAAVVGFLSGMEQTKVGATLAELRELAYESAIVPEQRVVSDELGQQLLPRFGERPEAFEVGFDYSQVRVLQEDENARSTRILGQLHGGAITLAEARGELGHDFEDGDDYFLREVRLVEVPREGMGELLMEAPESEDELAPRRRPQAAGRKRRVKRQEPTQLERRLLRLFRANARAVQERWQPELEASLDDLGSRLASAYQSRKRRKQADPEDVELVLALLADVAIEEWLQRQLGPQYLRYYALAGELTYESVSTAFGIELGFNIADPLARQVVAEGGKRLGLADITGATREALFRALHEARSEQLGVPETARRIRQYVPEGRFRNAGARYRAEMIARTEAKYAQNVASLAAYRQSGVVTGVIAFDNQTGYDDADCVSRDGRVFAFEEADGISVDEHPNGTLSWGPAVPGITVPA